MSNMSNPNLIAEATLGEEGARFVRAFRIGAWQRFGVRDFNLGKRAEGALEACIQHDGRTAFVAFTMTHKSRAEGLVWSLEACQQDDGDLPEPETGTELGDLLDALSWVFEG